jgi:3-oxoacyl-[acyl-carrier protein] reductase
MDTRERCALVTGGGSGIGLSITRALLERGWKASICGRDAAKLSQASAELARQNPAWADRLFVAAVDVSRAEDVRRWVPETCERFGAPELLVNNAGVGAWGEITSLSEQQWDRALDTNLKGAFLCTREALPMMRNRGGGWIINIASLAGKKGMPGASAYCASKFALVGFTETLAREEAKNNIRATAICPGYVATRMVEAVEVPASEMIHPHDIAATVLYLLDLSPKSVVREILIERIGSI